MTDIAVNEANLAISEQEAEQCITDIKDGIEQAKRAVYKLWIGGWKSLRDDENQPYVSFRSAMLDRFQNRSIGQIYRLKNGRELELKLQEASDDESISIKDTHARELKKLPDQDAMLEALDEAQTLADAEGSQTPEARHIKAGVHKVMSKNTVNKSEHHLLRHMMTKGDISPVVAADFVSELDKLTPAQRIYVQTLILKHGMSDSKLIPLMASDFERKDTGDPSRVLQWLEEDGRLMNTPLAVATVKDWGKAKYESGKQRAAERKAQSDAEKRKRGEDVVEKVLCTLYKGDAEKTLKVLKSTLGEDDFEALKQLILMENDPSPAG